MECLHKLSWSQVLSPVSVLLTLQVLQCAQGRAHQYELVGVGGSHALYPPWTPCHNGSLTVEFRTRRPNALLVYAQSLQRQTVVQVSLVEGCGRLHVHLPHTHAPTTISLSIGYRLDDGSWHRLEVRLQSLITGTHLAFIVDDLYQTVPLHYLNDDLLDDVIFDHIYVGGMPFDVNTNTLLMATVAMEPRFQGAVRDVITSECGEQQAIVEPVYVTGDTNDSVKLCDSGQVCLHEGYCVQSVSAGIVCHCHNTGHDGALCERPAEEKVVSVTGASSLTWVLPSHSLPLLTTSLNFSLSFRTWHATGLLLHLEHKEDYAMVALLEGTLVAMVNISSGVFRSVVTASRDQHVTWDNGEWHRVTVSLQARELTNDRGVCEVTVTVDGVKQSGTVVGQFSMLAVSGVHVAHVPAHLSANILPTPHTKTRFKGCLKEIVLRTDVVRLDLLQQQPTMAAVTETDQVTGQVTDQVTGLVTVESLSSLQWDVCDNNSSPLTVHASTSLLELPAWDTASGGLRLSLRTLHPDGLLLYQRGRHRSSFVAMELVDGRLYFVVGTQRKTARLQARAETVADGRWHSVAVTVEGGRGKVTVDSQSLSFQLDTRDNSYTTDTLYLGAAGRNAAHLPPQVWTGRLGLGFIGCLQDVVVNERRQQLATLAAQQSDDGLAMGCRRLAGSFCASNPCLHGGVCTDGWASAVCDCHLTAYYGDRCEIEGLLLEFSQGSSVVVSRASMVYSEADDISLRFRTTQQMATLFSLTSSLSHNYFQLRLIQGKLAVRIHIKGNQQASIHGN